MKNFSLPIFIALTAMLVACGGEKQQDDTINDVTIAVDETFRPILEEEMKVFNARHPEAILKPTYLPETNAINLLLQDSVRMIVSTRELSQQEKDAIWATYTLKVNQHPIGYDAVALIINKENTDSLINISEIEKIVTGQITHWNQIQNARTPGEVEVVFDNANSSIVRYVRDSICGGAELKGNLKEAKSNEAVIDYVSKTRNAIGIIGVDWLRNRNDSTRLTFHPDIRVMSVGYSAVTEPANCYQPVQYYIATGDYPLTRSVYMITTDPRTRSMAKSFFYFVHDQDGQLVLTKSSQLLPYMPVHIISVDNR